MKLQSHYNSTLDTPRMIAGQANNPKTSRAGGRGERQERARGHPPRAHEPNGAQEKMAREDGKRDPRISSLGPNPARPYPCNLKDKDAVL